MGASRRNAEGWGVAMKTVQQLISDAADMLNHDGALSPPELETKLVNHFAILYRNESLQTADLLKRIEELKAEGNAYESKVW